MTTKKPAKYKDWVALPSIRKDQAQAAVKSMCAHHNLDYKELIQRGDTLNTKLHSLDYSDVFPLLWNLTAEEWITLAMANMVSNENLNYWCKQRAFVFKLVDGAITRNNMSPKMATIIGKTLLDKWGWQSQNFKVKYVSH